MQRRNWLRHLNWAIPVLLAVITLSWLLGGMIVGHKGAQVSEAIIRHDVPIVLHRAGAGAAAVTYYDLNRYLSLPGPWGLQESRSVSPGPASPAQFMIVDIWRRGGSTLGSDRVAAEGAVRTWRYLSDRSPVFAIAGVFTAVYPTWGNTAGICAYLSRERYQELSQAAEARGVPVTVAALAAQVRAGQCPVDYRTLMKDDQTASQ